MMPVRRGAAAAMREIADFAVTQLTSGLVGHWTNVSCSKAIDDGTWPAKPGSHRKLSV